MIIFPAKYCFGEADTVGRDVFWSNISISIISPDSLKIYKIVMATFVANFRFGEADKERKDVFSTDSPILTPNILLSQRFSSL